MSAPEHKGTDRGAHVMLRAWRSASVCAHPMPISVPCPDQYHIYPLHAQISPSRPRSVPRAPPDQWWDQDLNLEELLGDGSARGLRQPCHRPHLSENINKKRKKKRKTGQRGERDRWGRSGEGGRACLPRSRSPVGPDRSSVQNTRSSIQYEHRQAVGNLWLSTPAGTVLAQHKRMIISLLTVQSTA
eukprot:479560-Rhodomonas_salina.1